MIKSINSKELRLIFVDLDRTLFDYNTARDGATQIAIEQLSLDVPPTEAIEFWERSVEHALGLQRIGFPDFGRIWNAKSIYYLIHVISSNQFRHQLIEFFDFLEQLSILEDDFAIRNFIEEATILRRFENQLELTRRDLLVQQQVLRAYLRFEQETAILEPFPGAREFLSSLMRVQNNQVLVVTEGNEYIQWQKIEKLGLDDLITPVRFVVTDRVADPPGLLLRLKAYAENLKKASMVHDHDMEERVHLQLEALDFFRDLLERLRYKKDGDFYRQTLHIAMQTLVGTGTQAYFSNVSQNDWTRFGPIKIASFGDRYMNDIQPLMKIFGREALLSVHMLYGKYKKEMPDDELSPDIAVHRLAAARDYLLEEANWERKDAIGRPTHFSIELEGVETSFALVGLIMEPVSQIAEALLHDMGFDSSEISALRREVTSEFFLSESSMSLRDRLVNLLAR